MRKLKGFTLIELLIVVAIIGILATVIIINLTSAQNKAKDAKLQSDLGLVSNAAEIYRTDATVFPAAFSTTTSVKGWDLTNAMTDSLTLDGNKLIAAAPKHPVTGKTIKLITDKNATQAVATPPIFSTKYIVYGESAVIPGKFLSYYTGKIYERADTEPIAAK